ncbi:MAG: acyl-CoA dehydrogenase family protein [Candidatus Aceula lacicola]|nr:acyl-CoA dehydrogenase family protein [Candidatus Aceula lacicola]
MIVCLEKSRQKLPSKIVSIFIAICFLFSSIAPAYAQSLSALPVPGTMVAPTPGFFPVLVRALEINPDNPLQFGFIVDNGDTGLEGDELTREAKKLIRYFLASLTTPEKDMWVNLSPYEQDRIVSENLGQTQMGRDLLAQDYILKQLTASLIYPEDELGKKFWDKIYKAAYEKFGTTDIPLNTFNKVWIVPKTAKVYEHDNKVFVIESKLEVMMEEDYLSLMENMGNKSIGADKQSESTSKEISAVSSSIVREIILPEIEKEVNQGKNFASLRQIYNAMILAAWYKNNLKESLLGKVYVDQGKTKGIELNDKQANQKIYDQYLEAFKKGVYDYIKVESDPQTGRNIPRKYFSGGVVSVSSSGVPLSGMVQNVVPYARDIVQKGDVNRYNIGLVENTDDVISSGIKKKKALPGQAVFAMGALNAYNNRFKDNPATIPASKRKEMEWPSVLKDPDNAVNIAISGIGAIGKLLIRQWRLYNNPNMNVVAIIGKLADPRKSEDENLQYQLANAKDIVEKTKFSSAHGKFDAAELEAGIDDKGVFIKIDPDTSREKRISVVDRQKDAANYPWKSLDVDILIEASGNATEVSQARKHVEAGAKRVLIAAPGKGVEGTYVVGVNEEKFDPTDPKQVVVSNASCTTNAIAPAMSVVEKIGFVAGSMNSTHAATNNQRLLDFSFLAKTEQGWGALRNISLTGTGASKALKQLGKSLWARMTGSAYRVGTATGSVITLDWKLIDPNTTVEDIIKEFEEAQDGYLKGILKIDNSLSTRDILDTTEGAIVSRQSIKIVRDGDDAMAHVQIWYDNEYGYTTQLMKMIDEIAKKTEMQKNGEKIIIKKDAPVELAPVALAKDIAEPEIPDNILEVRKPIKTLKRPVKVGLNGPGRVGRLFIRDLVGNPNIDLVSIPYSKPSDLARMISIDTVHRRLDADLEFNDTERWISINGKKIHVPYRSVEQPSIEEILDELGVDKTREDISVDSKKGILKVGKKELRIWSERPTEPADIDWSADGAEIVIDATGKYVEPGMLAGHLGGTVKKVILAAPAKSLKEPGAPGIDGTFVYGVNEKDFDARKQASLSNASCTTNALAPVVKVIQDVFGVKIGMMSTTHSETVSYSNLDSRKKSASREPGSPDNITLTTTGAAKALGLVIKELKGKLDGDALRVPSPDGSIINLTIETKKPVKDAATLNKVLKIASEGYLKGLLAVEKIETVKHVIGRLEAAVVAEQGTSVQQLPNGGSLIKIHIFYDNERGYNAQLIRFTEYVGQESLAAGVLLAKVSSAIPGKDFADVESFSINMPENEIRTLIEIEGGLKIKEIRSSDSRKVKSDDDAVRYLYGTGNTVRKDHDTLDVIFESDKVGAFVEYKRDNEAGLWKRVRVSSNIAATKEDALQSKVIEILPSHGLSPRIKGKDEIKRFLEGKRDRSGLSIMGILRQLETDYGIERIDIQPVPLRGTVAEFINYISKNAKINSSSRERTENMIRQAVVKVSPKKSVELVSQIDLAKTPEDYGIDSDNFMFLSYEIERLYGVEVDDAFLQMPINELVYVVETKNLRIPAENIISDSFSQKTFKIDNKMRTFDGQITSLYSPKVDQTLKVRSIGVNRDVVEAYIEEGNTLDEEAMMFNPPEGVVEIKSDMVLGVVRNEILRRGLDSVREKFQGPIIKTMVGRTISGKDAVVSSTLTSEQEKQINAVFKNLIASDILELMTEEEQMFVDSAKDFAQRYLLPNRLYWDEEGAKNENGKIILPEGYQEALDKFSELGFMSLIIPEAYGGMGMDFSVIYRVILELAKASPSFSVTIAVNTSVIAAIMEHGTDEQKEKYLPLIAEGKSHGAMVITEPEAGSDVQAITLKAEDQTDDLIAKEKGEFYILNGTKHFITSVGIADVYIVLAVTGKKPNGRKEISAFLVDAKTPGISTGSELHHKLGQKASPTAFLGFDNVKVSKDNLLGNRGKGMGIILSMLTDGRITIMSLAVGIAQAAYENAVQFASERKQSGKYINELPAIQNKLEEMEWAVSAAKLLLNYTASINDDSAENLVKRSALALAASSGKTFAGETAENVADHDIQIHGGPGYMVDYIPQLLWRDARITTIYEGTSEIQRLIILGTLLNLFTEKEKRGGGVTDIAQMDIYTKSVSDYLSVNLEKETAPEELKEMYKVIKTFEVGLNKQLMALKDDPNNKVYEKTISDLFTYWTIARLTLLVTLKLNEEELNSVASISKLRDKYQEHARVATEKLPIAWRLYKQQQKTVARRPDTAISSGIVIDCLSGRFDVNYLVSKITTKMKDFSYFEIKEDSYLDQFVELGAGVVVQDFAEGIKLNKNDELILGFRKKGEEGKEFPYFIKIKQSDFKITIDLPKIDVAAGEAVVQMFEEMLKSASSTVVFQDKVEANSVYDVVAYIRNSKKGNYGIPYEINLYGSDHFMKGNGFPGNVRKGKFNEFFDKEKSENWHLTKEEEVASIVFIFKVKQGHDGVEFYEKQTTITATRVAGTNFWKLEGEGEWDRKVVGFKIAKTKMREAAQIMGGQPAIKVVEAFKPILNDIFEIKDSSIQVTIGEGQKSLKVQTPSVDSEWKGGLEEWSLEKWTEKKAKISSNVVLDRMNKQIGEKISKGLSPEQAQQKAMELVKGLKAGSLGGNFFDSYNNFGIGYRFMIFDGSWRAVTVYDAKDRVNIDANKAKKYTEKTSSAFPVGGINLDSGLLDLQIERDGNGVPLPVSQQPIETMNIQGFSFYIMSITPVASLFLLSGIFDPNKKEASLDLDQDLQAKLSDRFQAEEPRRVSALS